MDLGRAQSNAVNHPRYPTVVFWLSLTWNPWLILLVGGIPTPLKNDGVRQLG